MGNQLTASSPFVLQTLFFTSSLTCWFFRQKNNINQPEHPKKIYGLIHLENASSPKCTDLYYQYPRTDYRLKLQYTHFFFKHFSVSEFAALAKILEQLFYFICFILPICFIFLLLVLFLALALLLLLLFFLPEMVELKLPSHVLLHSKSTKTDQFAVFKML